MKHDDQVDSLSYLGLMLDMFVEGKTEKEVKDDEYEEDVESSANYEIGKSKTCGY